jgi:hypothetical protein
MSCRCPIGSLILAVLLVALGAAGAAEARTWYVERDGSGDFTVIQDAVDAAASGDTIRIGPGRFDEGQMVSPPGWTEYVRVLVSQAELTIVGSGASTIIGQTETWDLSQGRHKGIVAHGWWGNQHIVIRDIRFENMGEAILVGGSNTAEVLDCSFWHNFRSTVTFDGNVLYVQDCRFENVERNGYHVLALDQGRVEIRDSELLLYHYHQWVQQAVNFTNVAEGLIEDCVFRGGMGVSVGTTGSTEVRRCLFENQWYASTNVGDRGTLVIEECTYRNVNVAIGVDVYNVTVIVRNCVVESVIDCSVHVNDRMHVSIQDSDLAHGERGAVYVLNCSTSPPPILDFTNNYWGTDDPEEIAALIRDRNDDPAVCAYVNFVPFRSHSVPVQQQTWTEVKGLFRD